MSVREPVGTLARARQWAIFGQIRTRKLRYSAQFMQTPQLSVRAVNTLITAAFRTNRAMPRNARSGSNPARVAFLVNERVYSHAINRWALAAFGHFLGY